MSRGSVSASGTAQGVVFRHLQLMTTRRFLLPSGYDPSRPNRLRALRLERGLSLDALAQRCVPPTTKGQIEKLEWGPHHVHGVRMDIMWMYRLGGGGGGGARAPPPPPPRPRSRLRPRRPPA